MELSEEDPWFTQENVDDLELELTPAHLQLKPISKVSKKHQSDFVNFSPNMFKAPTINNETFEKEF